MTSAPTAEAARSRSDVVGSTCAAGAVAGLGAGIVLSALFVGLETVTGETAEVVRLQRRTLRRVGADPRHESAAARAD